MKKTVVLLLCTFGLLQGWANDPNQRSFPGDRVEGDCADRLENLVDDRAFMRRMWLDLTGVIPDENTITNFANSQDPDKRTKMINLAVNSGAFVDRWTNYFEEMFRSQYVLFPKPLFRNEFHNTLRSWVAENRPWNDMARDLIQYAGLGIEQASAMTFWLTTFVDSDFRLDVLDDQTTFITETMLGLKTDCISCHDGAYHLEEINKGLSTMTRQQFWELSSFLASSYLYLPVDAFDDRGDDEAFFSQLYLVDVDDPGFVHEGYLVAEEPYHTGEYLAQSEAGDGMRKPRDGGIVAPRYFRTGEAPMPGEPRRQALARMITNDRQFARNMVNRIWAHLVGEGFVEPLDAWDLARLDESTAAEFGTTVQAKNPELMEALTDFFIDSDYDLRVLIREIAGTSIYQWDYTKSTPCRDAYAYWRGDQRVRRLEAEAIYEAYLRFLDIDFQYMVSGIYDRTFYSTWQMPDSIEPNPGLIFAEGRDDLLFDPIELGYQSFDDYYLSQAIALTMMFQLGRDDRQNDIPRTVDGSIQMALLMMNNPITTFYLDNIDASPFLASMRDRAQRGSPDDYRFVVETMFRRALVRLPTELEMDAALAAFVAGEETKAVANLGWVLVNHPDFLYK